jgi:hypothetical protein
MKDTHRTTVGACVPVPSLFSADTHVVTIVIKIPWIPYSIPGVVEEGSVERTKTR